MPLPTLRLPVATFTVTHTQPMSKSDPQHGAFHRRYRDDRSLRTWTLVLRAGRASRLWSEYQFDQGASGSAQWDWVPPREADPIRVRFVSLNWDIANTASGYPEATVVEDRSSDVAAA